MGVGDVSIEETRKLYREAKTELLILTRAIEYYPQVAEDLDAAVKRGVRVRILLRSRSTLKPSDAAKRDTSLKVHRCPREQRRGTSDGRRHHKGLHSQTPQAGGRAMFLVEEVGVPYHLREAAITSHPSVVRGLADMFNLRWAHESELPD